MYARIYTYVRKCISYKALTHTATYYNSWYVVGIINPKITKNSLCININQKCALFFF